MSTKPKASLGASERYIWEKPHARFLWFRMAVPTRFRHIESRKIVQCCLGTRDRREASVLAAKTRAELHASWDRDLRGDGPVVTLPSNRPLTPPLLISLQATAGVYAFETVTTQLAKLRASKGLASAEELEAYTSSLRKQLLRLIATKDGAARAQWEGIADRAIVREGWLLPKDSSEYEAFIGMIGDAVIDALKVSLEREGGDFGARPTSPVVIAAREAQAASAKAGEGISELYERYAAERAAEKAKRHDTIEQDRKIVGLFEVFVGSGRSLQSITSADIRDWKAVLSATPPNYRKMLAYAGLSQREAAVRAKADGKKGLSPTTVNKHLSAVSALFTWARKNSFAEINPCDGLFYEKSKLGKSRPPFSVAQFNRLISSPLFMGFERDGKEFRPGPVTADDWRFWVPLICMFTGARIGEIAQLRIDDIRYQHGTWVVHIRFDEERGQTTKSGYSRFAPVHKILRDIGFLPFLKRQRVKAKVSGNDQLFPELKPNKRGQIGSTPSRFWRNYLSRIGLKEGADGIGSHSFRHALTDQLRAADFLDDSIEVALGHNQKTVTSGYGQMKQGTVALLRDMFEKITFPGVRFDDLFVPCRRNAV